MKKLFFLLILMHSVWISGGFCAETDYTGDESNIFVLPVAMYSTDTGFGGGAALLKSYHTSSERTSTIQLLGLYTTKKQLTFSSKLIHYVNKNNDKIDINFKYSKFPTYFFGLGNNTPNDNPDSYTPEFVDVRLKYEHSLTSNLKIKGLFYLRKQALIKSEQGGILETSSASWISGRLDAAPGFGILWESRDNLYATKHGMLAQFLYLGYMFQDYGGSFETASFDIRKFFNPFSNVVFANMFWLVSSKGEVPFYLLPGLGGEDRLRGYEYNRFIGKNLALFQHDTRFSIWGPFGGTVFIATGRVADKVSSLFYGRYHTSGGIGLRYYFDREENLVLRFDQAFGSDSNSFYASFSEAF